MVSPVEFVEHLKASVDIVRVVSDYVRLRKAGTRFVGLCPFHTEKTPSFGVNATLQYYKCFGCGAGGDVLKFVMEVERIGFYDALKLLSERFGVPMPKRTEPADAETQLRAAAYRMNEMAARHFEEMLQSSAGREARGYLERRGITRETTQRFQLGLSPRTGQALVSLFQREGFSPEQMEASGLVARRQDGSGLYDRFRGRLMFPIHSESGKVIAFGGRALEDGDEPKYLNSPETAIYRKKVVLYNLHRAKTAIRKAGRAVLVEGYMDAIGVSDAGIEEVVAPCGTALASEQVQVLKRHTDRVTVSFDMDTAGSAAAERAITPLVEHGISVRVLTLSEGKDPDEFVRAQGGEAFQKALDRATPYFHWLADRARSRHDLRSADGRYQAFQELLPALQRIGDKIERLAAANDIAAYLGVDTGTVLEQFRKAATERRAAAPTPPPEANVSPAEFLLLRTLLVNADARAAVIEALEAQLPRLGIRSRPLFEALLRESRAAGPEGAISYDRIAEGLGEGDKRLLEHIVFADAMDEGALTPDQAFACLTALEAAGVESRRTELRNAVKQAERSGDLREALRLTNELLLLERK